MKKIVVLLVALVIVGVICFATAGCNRTEVAAAASQRAQTSSAADTPATVTPTALASVPASTPSESVGQAAIRKAADENKYLFLFVSENDNEETATAKRAVEAAATKLGDKAQWASIDRNSASEKALADEFQLSRAPVPIVLALAPNGTITGAFFGEKLKDPKLEESIAGESEQHCLKALQDRKLVFLCAQNAATKSNDAAMQGVNDFKSDSRFSQFTEIVKVDPAAASEQSFLAKLKLDPTMTEATTAFLAPPGSIIKTISGATTKDALLASLQAASSGGCGAGGCGPKGCGPRR
jgi:hypothetical protein